MQLAELIRNLPIAAPPLPGLEVTGLTHDSRRVEPGDLFVALAGERADGRVFAAEAERRGAVAVLAVSPAGGTSVIPWLSTPDPRSLLGALASRLYERPDRRLTLVGVTGTNGKSTMVALAAAMLDAAGRPAGRLGTLGYVFGERRWPGERTTPEATDFYRTLSEMADAGAAAAVAEVSSHALALGRVAGAIFDVAAFTNLTRDHLDFHRDLEDYFAAKRRLFLQLAEGGRAVIAVDDPFGRRLADELPGALTCGEGGEVAVESAQLDARGIRATFGTPRGSLETSAQLRGRYNLANLLLAVGIGEALALDHAAMAAGVAGLAPLPGRLEPVEAGQENPVFVDYAHTPAALEAALRSLRELVSGRLVCVFGCGGERDAGKRPLMGRLAGELADVAILTSDNPRGEDPSAILAAVEEGLAASGAAGYEVIPDRRSAIARALELGTADGAVLVAGKGHETVQIVGAERRPFSDREVILRALEERHGRAAGG